MDRCRAVELPAGRTAKKKHEPTFIEKCSEVTLPARAAAVRTVARFSAPVLETCGVQMAKEEPSFEPVPIQRPARKEDFEKPELVVEPEEEEEDDEKVVIRVAVSRAKGLPQADFMGTADPYVEFLVVAGDPTNAEEFRPRDVQKGHDSKVVDAKTIFKAKTKTIRGSLDPVWDEHWVFDVPYGNTVGELFLYFRLYDYDLIKSDDFLGHVSVSLMDALVAGRQLSSGWRALLRNCGEICDRIDILRDERLQSRPLPTYRLQHVPGQENSYNLSESELSIEVEMLQKRPNARQKLGLRKSAPPVGSEEKEALQRELLLAARDGQIPAARTALTSGAAVNCTAANGPLKGCSPLHIACLRSCSDLAMALVDVFNASLVQRAPGGRSAAMCACEGGDEALAEWLIVEGVPADLRDENGETVLFYSARYALPQLTSWLLGKQRHPAGDLSKNNSTPLMIAASSRKQASMVVVQQLMDAHADANRSNDDRQTALHFACRVGDDRCAALLLKLRADAGNLDGEGRTALDVARSSGMPEVMLSRLSNLGADVKGGVGIHGQQRGESAADAEKREMRAKKAEVSAAQNWSTWRQAHPWRGLSPESKVGIRRTMSLGSPRSLPASPRSFHFQDSQHAVVYSARSRLSHGDVPLYIGSITNNAEGKQIGRIARLKSWASNFKGGRSKSPPAPVPVRAQATNSVANWSPLDSNTWSPADGFT